MIEVYEKDEYRFRGEERIVENSDACKVFDIKGFDDGDWFEEMSNGETLHNITVNFRSNHFIYDDVQLSSRKSSDCTKFMDDLMMEYVKNIEIFAPLEDIIKDKRYIIAYRIEQVDVDSQFLSVVLEDNSYKNRIKKNSKIYEWNPIPHDVIKEWKKLLSAVLDAIDGKKEPSLAEVIDVQAEMEERIRNESIRRELVKEGVDIVNHPGHYETGKFECIEVMQEALGMDAVKDFCICNAFKYLYRHKRKNGLEDIKKAKWYIDKYLELSEEESNG